jgi:hypothetical protein
VTKTYVFQVELEYVEGQDPQPLLKQLLDTIARDLHALKADGKDPPFRVNVIDLGHREATKSDGS